MPNNRASLFLSFDSLKGFDDYIAKKQRVVVERKELAPDLLDELDWKIKEVKVGQMIKIVYYDQNEYVELEGMVSKIDLKVDKVIRIVDREIKITEIVNLQI